MFRVLDCKCASYTFINAKKKIKLCEGILLGYGRDCVQIQHIHTNGLQVLYVCDIYIVLMNFVWLLVSNCFKQIVCGNHE